MARLREIHESSLTDGQRAIMQAVTSSRKTGLGGPFSVWYRVPHIAEPANNLHNLFRLNSRLGRQLLELLILVVADSAASEYVWVFHSKQALNLGVPHDIIEGIRCGKIPSTCSQKELTLFRVVNQLLRLKTISGDLYDEALTTFGEDLLIEIVTAVGYYSMVCLVVNAFDVPPPVS